VPADAVAVYCSAKTALENEIVEPDTL